MRYGTTAKVFNVPHWLTAHHNWDERWILYIVHTECLSRILDIIFCTTLCVYCTVLVCCAVLCYSMLFRAVLYYIVLYVLLSTMLCCVIISSTVLCCAVLYCTVLYCVVLCCVVYFTVFCVVMPSCVASRLAVPSLVEFCCIDSHLVDNHHNPLRPTSCSDLVSQIF